MPRARGQEEFPPSWAAGGEQGVMQNLGEPGNLSMPGKGPPEPGVGLVSWVPQPQQVGGAGSRLLPPHQGGQPEGCVGPVTEPHLGFCWNFLHSDEKNQGCENRIQGAGAGFRLCLMYVFICGCFLSTTKAFSCWLAPGNWVSGSWNSTRSGELPSPSVM